MDKHILYGRLMNKASIRNDNTKLKHINQPDPIILGFKQKFALFLIGFLDKVGYNKTY